MTKLLMDGATLRSLKEVVKSMGMQKFTLLVQGGTAKVCAIDHAHVALIEATYAISGGPPEPLEVLVDTEKFEGAIKPFVGDDEVEVDLWTTPEECGPTGHLRMWLTKGRKKRSVSLLDPKDSQRPRMPDLKHDVVCEVPTAFLRACIANSPDDMESISLSVKGGVLTWFTGNDTATETFEDSIAVEVPADAPEVVSLYSPEYLLDTLKPATSKAVKVCLRTDYPLMLKYDVGSAVEEGVFRGKAVAMVAPRIPTEG
jgi:hypothetical protein